MGLLLRAFAEPLHSIQAAPLTGWILFVSALLQFFSGLAFVINSWKRVRVR
jgi:hypothetical protein